MNHIVKELKTIQKQLGEVPILLHTDLLRIGMIADPADREAFCKAYEEVLEEVFGGQTYLLPTFNYDYCQTGIYDVKHCPSQVGGPYRILSTALSRLPYSHAYLPFLCAA